MHSAERLPGAGRAPLILDSRMSLVPHTFALCANVWESETSRGNRRTRTPPTHQKKVEWGTRPKTSRVGNVTV